MHEKHAEFSGLPCMTNMQNVLGFLDQRKLSLVYYCMHEKHAEFYGFSCMTNMQNFSGFLD